MLADSTGIDVANEEVLPIAQTIPQFTCKKDERTWSLQEMAGAFRLCARRGFGIGSAGHISVRDPENPNEFWLNPLGQHFGTLKASDMVKVDHEGNVIGGSRRAVNKAGFQIHGAIHKARPDVNAAIHMHSIYGKAYSAFGRPLDMLSQDACLFHNDQAVYKSFGGVVLSKDEGSQIAKASGGKRSLILQNHGLLNVGATVGECVALYLLMEQSCQAQLAADATDKPTKIIGDGVAAFTFKAMAYPESLWFEFSCDLEYEEFLDPSYKE